MRNIIGLIKLNVSLLRKDKFAIVAIIILGIFATIVWISIPIFLKVFFDSITFDKDSVKLYAKLLLVTFAINSFTGIINAYLVGYYKGKLIKLLRSELFAHILKLGEKVFIKKGSGYLLTRYQEANEIQSGFIDKFLLFTANIIVLTACNIIYIIYTPQIYWLAILTTPVNLITAYLINRYVPKLTENFKESIALQNEKVQEYFNNWENIKAQSIEQKILSIHNEYNISQFTKYKKYIKTSVILGQIPQVTVLLSTGIFYFVGSGYVLDGLITIGSFIASSTLLSTISQNSFQIYQSLIDINTASGVSNRITEIRELKSETLQGDLIIQKNYNSLTVNNISFSYIENTSTGKLFFDNISLVFNTNKVTSIIGGSGSGKTTLMRLLLRIYEPKSGAMYLDEIDLKEFKLENYRKHIGYVPQVPFIFMGSVYENIKLLNENLTLPQIIDVCKKYNVHDNFMNLENGYETVISEGGASLSGGQRQLINLIRVLVKNSQILILDEPTSNMDAILVDKFFNIINSVKKDKIIIMISHDSKVIDYSDIVYEVEKGHFTLLNKKNISVEKLLPSK